MYGQDNINQVYDFDNLQRWEK